MNTCYSCRHWDQHADDQNWGECELAYSYGNKPDVEETLAFTIVGSTKTLVSSLQTNREFFCNQFVEDN